MMSDNHVENISKPILWIHIPFELNARSWETFYSRNTNKLNLPYVHMCIRSIVEHCSNKFHIVIVDDTSFERLLPEWKYDLSQIGSPLKEKYRYLGLTKLLYKFGGMLVPRSMLVFKCLFQMYLEGCNNELPFVVEKNVQNHCFKGDHRFIGCIKNCNIMKNFIEFQEKLNHRDYTNESVFLNILNEWIYKHCASFNVVDGKKIGIKTDDNKPILLENLFETKRLNLACCNYGILIPENELMKRHKYNWFCKMNENEIISGEFILSKYFVIALSKIYVVNNIIF